MVVEINLEFCTDKEEVLKKISHVLKFPDYVGANWDGLFNCFTMAIDLSETKLVFTNYGEFRTSEPEAFNALLSVLDYTKKNYFGRNFDYEFQR